MKLSVIVPMYNSQNYIERCINSIINQNIDDMEIILINDGSIDSTKYIVQKYADIYPNIKLINKEKNQGIGAARNTGLKVAKGEYITFVDSDDYIECGMYKEMYKLGKENDSDLVMCSYLRKYKDLDEEVKLNINQDYIVYNRIQIEKNIIPTFVKNIEYGYYYVWNKLYKKDFLYKNNIYFKEKIKFAEDWFFNLDVFDKIDQFLYVNKPYYNYLDNAGSLSKDIDVDRINLYLEGHRMKYYFIEKYNLKNKEVDSKLLEEIYVYIYNLIISKNSYEIKKDIIKSVSKNNQFLNCLYCIDEQPRFIKYILILLKNNQITLLNISIKLYKIFKKGDK